MTLITNECKIMEIDVSNLKFITASEHVEYVYIYAYIRSDLHCIQATFAGKQTHDLGVASTMIYMNA